MKQSNIKFIILGDFETNDTELVNFLINDAKTINSNNTILLNKLMTNIYKLEEEINYNNEDNDTKIIEDKNLVININILNNKIHLGKYNKKNKDIDYIKKWEKINDLHSKELIDVINSF